jgi:hypothetical protein
MHVPHLSTSFVPHLSHILDSLALAVKALGGAGVAVGEAIELAGGAFVSWSAAELSVWWGEAVWVNEQNLLAIEVFVEEGSPGGPETINIQDIIDTIIADGITVQAAIDSL